MEGITPRPLTGQFLTDVAAALPGRWMAKMVHEHSGQLIETSATDEPTGLVLVAFCPPRADRVEWAGVFPKDRAGSLYMPRDALRITTALSRPSTAVARDLERRLLTWYRTEVTIALERVTEANRRYDDAAATAAALGRAFRQEPREGRFWFDQGTVEVGVSGIRVHLTLPLDAAAALGAALLPLLARAGQPVLETVHRPTR